MGGCWGTDSSAPPCPRPQDLVSKLLQLHFTDSKTKGLWTPAGGRVRPGAARHLGPWTAARGGAEASGRVGGHLREAATGRE